jgi:hypothetical protein
MGGLFIVVVMYFPNGLAGVIEQHREKFNSIFQTMKTVVTRWMQQRRPPAGSPPASVDVP